MEMNQIRYFVALSEEHSFTRAADRCGVTQPSLSRAIKRLEDHFGGPLFERGRKRTALSALGTALLPYLKAIGEAAEAAGLEARAMQPGQAGPQPHDRRKLDRPRGCNVAPGDWFSSNPERIRHARAIVSSD